jgi:hypothetical protein
MFVTSHANQNSLFFTSAFYHDRNASIATAKMFRLGVSDLNFSRECSLLRNYIHTSINSTSPELLVFDFFILI